MGISCLKEFSLTSLSLASRSHFLLTFFPFQKDVNPSPLMRILLRKIYIVRFSFWAVDHQHLSGAPGPFP